jgi:hypothetical protein
VVNDLPTLKDFSNLCSKANPKNGVTIFQPVFKNQEAIRHMQVFDFNYQFNYLYCSENEQNINLKNGEKLVMVVYYTYCNPGDYYYNSQELTFTDRMATNPAHNNTFRRNNAQFLCTIVFISWMDL